MPDHLEPELWQRLEAVFQTVSEAPSGARPQMLDELCADDPMLRREVESLLAASEHTSGFLENPVHEAAHGVIVNPAAEGRRIGEYVVIRPIGAGGMGTVYLGARADGEFEQQVAIKQIHAGLSFGERSLARFRTERQILANLQHPNICRLLTGGVTEDGLPYLVMEFVDGVSIVEYCEQRDLRLEERLKLFQDVCSAVEYAHSNLVIHRDIKPANILVTAAGVPKLLDFGIAKLVEEEGAATPARTVATELLLTPDYASPEQILGKRITTAADVYALGVLLYEMLSGQRPFGSAATNPVEVVRRICSETPPSLDVTAARSLQPRGIEPKKLKGELDNVVQMAMRREPERRYRTVAQMSADLQAYLDGAPLLAAPDSWSYRTGKFIARHKVSAAAAALVAITLVVLSIAMSLLAHRATREQAKAEQEAQFLASMFRAATPEEGRGRVITARELLDRGRERVYKNLASQPDVEATMLQNIASAYRSLGATDQALPVMQRAYSIRKRLQGQNALATLESLEGVAELYRDQGRYAQAEPLLRQVVTGRESQLAANDPAVVDAMGNLGECLYWEGKNREAEAILRIAIDRNAGAPPDGRGGSLRNYLALVLERRSDFNDAARLLSEAVDIVRRTDGPNSPVYITSMHNLASALIDQGDLTGAETKLRENAGLARKVLGTDNPEYPMTLNNLAFVLLEEGKTRAAEPVAQETLQLWARQYGDSHNRVGVALLKWGRILEESGNYPAAADAYGRTLQIFSHNGAPPWMEAAAFDALSELELDRKDYKKAEQDAQQAIVLGRKDAGEDGPELAPALTHLALAREVSGHAPEAEAPMRQALFLRKAKLPADHPAVMASEIRLGEVLLQEGKIQEAEPYLKHADSVAHRPPVRLLSWQVAEADRALGEWYRASGDLAQGTELIARSKEALSSDPHLAIRQMTAR